MSLIVLYMVVSAFAAEDSAGTVTIHRDPWGVPHVYAASEAGGFYGLGYAQAEDRLEALLGLVMWARGRRAEVEGESALALDVTMRQWRHEVEAARAFPNLDPQLRENYRAFVAGVRAWMSRHPKTVPDWAPDLKPEDFVMLPRAMYFTGYNARLGPAECARGDISPSGSAGFGASNGWALMPQRTAGDSTILLADPHVQVANPFYYEYRLHAGTLESAGFAVGPLLWQAHNRRLGWAMTTGNPDLWDCYAVTVDPADPKRYLYDGQPRRIHAVTEVFEVAGGDSVKREFEYLEINGVLAPVVAREGDAAFAVAMSQMHDAGLLDEEILRMNRARSIDELRAALSTLGMFPQNIIAADAGGNIYYLRAGKTPRRPPGYDWSAAVPGNISATAWLGFHPIDEMIELKNPPQGYLTNNNVAPDRMFAEAVIRPEDYPSYLFYDTPGRTTRRGIRAVDVLSAARDFSLADAMALAVDEYWTTTAPWQHALRRALTGRAAQAVQLSASALALQRRILAFDGFARADSLAALNFYFWRMQAGQALLESDTAEALFAEPWAQSASRRWVQAILLDALESAARTQVEQAGGLDRPLGAVFRAIRGDENQPLGGPSIDLPDARCRRQDPPLCDATLRAFRFGPANDLGQRPVSRGSQSLRLMQFGPEGVHSWTAHAFGQQWDSQAPHGADQVMLFSQGRLKPSLFDQSELMPRVESTRTLTLPSDPAVPATSHAELKR